MTNTMFKTCLPCFKPNLEDDGDEESESQAAREAPSQGIKELRARFSAVDAAIRDYHRGLQRPSQENETSSETQPLVPKPTISKFTLAAYEEYWVQLKQAIEASESNVAVQSIEGLEQGDHLDPLCSRSGELSSQSKSFYSQGKKQPGWFDGWRFTMASATPRGDVERPIRAVRTGMFEEE